MGGINIPVDMEILCLVVLNTVLAKGINGEGALNTRANVAVGDHFSGGAVAVSASEILSRKTKGQGHVQMPLWQLLGQVSQSINFLSMQYLHLNLSSRFEIISFLVK